MKAVVVDGAGGIGLDEVPEPAPSASDIVVEVKAFSLNRGEVHAALTRAAAGSRPGWDFAGVVEQTAADGSGPRAGSRVVGLTAAGAWTERLATPAMMVAELPDTVSFEAAACLPVAGLTALHALRKRQRLEGARVLITGASGGVGVFAIQLGKLMGAHVTAALRNLDNEPLARRLGADAMALGPDLGAAARGPFDLILESVGGPTLGAALGLLAPGGTCVLFGASDNAVTTFNGTEFRVGGTSLYGLYLGYELQFEPPSVGLAHLGDLVGQGRLDPVVEVSAPWIEVGRIAQGLLDRRFVGKAVLTLP
jgi:NADPH:quinone reductase